MSPARSRRHVVHRRERMEIVKAVVVVGGDRRR